MFGFGKERKKPLVLHVDDDREIREIVAVTLIRLDLDVMLAHDGPAGLEMARRERPDLILLDIRMPGMDGFEVCHLLKSDAKTRGIPVVMLTAMDQG
ncbi:MAG: response regulator, partial [Elusimicrobia bacterium]|nr:response regulator [Elusimicrobiota bacterium]